MKAEIFLQSIKAAKCEHTTSIKLRATKEEEEAAEEEEGNMDR